MAALSFDAAQAYLGEVMDGLPQDIFEDLNGGVVLRPDIVMNRDTQHLYTLGTYHHEPQGLGRYIVINYGSFLQVYGRRPLAEQKAGLRKVLLHELTHHVESKAGVRDLELQDEMDIARYRGEEGE